MRLYLAGLLRLLVMTAAGLSTVAVWLGQQVPVTCEPRWLAPIRYHPLNLTLEQNEAARLYMLDSETGGVAHIQLPPADRIDFATCSPWLDGQGRTHVLGRWRSVAGGGIQAAGLIRIAIPGGEILDRVELEPPPFGYPCWFPDLSGRAIVSVQDGLLHLVSFRTRRERGGHGRPGNLPVPIAWRCRPPWSEHVQLREPTFSHDIRLKHRAFVSITIANADSSPGIPNGARLWWLRLSPSGLAIDDIGRLILNDSEDPTRRNQEERFPSIMTRPDGSIVLGYLSHAEESFDLELRLAVLTIDSETGNPRVQRSTSRLVARHREFARPAFSPDGRWIYSFPKAEPPSARAERFSVAAAFGEEETTVEEPPAHLGADVSLPASTSTSAADIRP